MPKGKGKGKNKGKGGKGKGGGQNRGKRNKGQQQQQQNQQRGSGSNSPKKPNNKPRAPNANQQRKLDELMLQEIDTMYSEHTQKHDSLRTFFGIFTRHNMLQLRQLMKVSIPDINGRLSDKFLKSAQNEANRDVNQFSWYILAHSVSALSDVIQCNDSIRSLVLYPSPFSISLPRRCGHRNVHHGITC